MDTSYRCPRHQQCRCGTDELVGKMFKRLSHEVRKAKKPTGVKMSVKLSFRHLEEGIMLKKVYNKKEMCQCYQCELEEKSRQEYKQTCQLDKLKEMRDYELTDIEGIHKCPKNNTLCYSHDLSKPKKQQKSFIEKSDVTQPSHSEEING